jgi:hypothetical protein
MVVLGAPLADDRIPNPIGNAELFGNRFIAIAAKRFIENLVRWPIALF